MTIDRLLARELQLQPVPGLDRLPDTELSQRLRQFLLVCQVENKSPKTIFTHGCFIKYFIQFLVANGLPTRLNEVSPDHVRLWIWSLQKRHLAPESVNSYYRSLHTFYNFLKTEKHIKKNPFEDILHAPQIPKKHVRPFPQDVIRNILKVCAADLTFSGQRNYAIVLLFFDTGIRQLEMAGMSLHDLYLQQGLIRVMGKGARERIVKMGDETRKALLRYLLLRKDENDAVWVDIHGRPITQGAIATVIRRIAIRAEIPKTTKRGSHTYRHSAATNYLRNHGDLKCLQEMMGHADIKTTMKYVDALGPEALIEDHRLASPVDNLLRK